MPWQLTYRNEEKDDPDWWEVKGEWSDEQVQKAVKDIKECVDAGGLYETKGSCAVQAVKKFLPGPLRDLM